MSTIDLSPEALAELADEALASGHPITHGPVVLVPDLMLLTGMANGMKIPPGWSLQRGDGRTVHVYRRPSRAARRMAS